MATGALRGKLVETHLAGSAIVVCIDEFAPLNLPALGT
jgi:hypothetical protein